MTHIIDHVGLTITEFERSRAFYTAALGTLGIGLVTEFAHDGQHLAGYGRERPDFWIADSQQVRSKTHVAFLARSRAEVNAFYTVALSMGGRDNGPPGLRPQYHPNYYGAFVFDPDGNNVEAVCHEPE